MIIPEFWIFFGGTGTRSELNYVLSLPFFLLFFLLSISLLFSHSSLSLPPPLFSEGWGIPPRGEGAVDKGGVRE